MPDTTVSPLRWMLLTHHLPAEPAYLRVKVRRRLERIGAIPLKNSVYALPATDDAREDLSWLRQEITAEGGEASLCEAVFLDGETGERLVARFRGVHEAAYRAISDEARALRQAPGSQAASEDRLDGLTRRLEEAMRQDGFGADGRAEARQAVADARRALRGDAARDAPADAPPDVGRGRTWVTRRGVKVDRIASAWLIRRHVDPEARFAFVDAQGYEPAAEELRFDMFEGEFTHVGEACTFETLARAFSLTDPALAALGEIVHDIDCKDGKFGRPETAGVASLFDGIVRNHEDDMERLARGAQLLDELHAHFRAT